MKLTIVGFGAGGKENMTLEAVAALSESDVIIGYSVYVDLVRPLFPEKRYLDTPMKQETERCRMAIEEALAGHDVALVCSGDSGVYGLASLVYTLSEQYPPLEITVVSGVTAACSGAAVLGAPLTHDFALISLSDLLTPWEKIATRLDCAAQADFVICLYNPSSKKRSDYLQKACDIILRHQGPDTCCGYVQHIGREGQNSRVLSLAQLRETQVDMFTTVFIGNSQTHVVGGKLVTPRGYRNV
jgi:precorrin-3B C17-methyltransferase